jgi:hypothetical protein
MSILPTYPTGDARTDKAVDIARTSYRWRRLVSRDGEIIHAIPSQTTTGVFYLVTPERCTCLDFQHCGLSRGRIGEPGFHGPCKHQIALALVELQQEAAAEGLVLERYGDGYEWFRR